LNSLSKALLAKTVDMTQTVVMDMFEGQIVFRKPVLAEEEIALDGYTGFHLSYSGFQIPWNGVIVINRTRLRRSRMN
jgi:hypothetical protein